MKLFVKNKIPLLTLLALLTGLQIASEKNLAFAENTHTLVALKNPPYQFEQFPAKAIEYDSHKKPALSSKLARQYKTLITAAMSEPANFAGHYRVARWGCGTDCRGFAIINKLTGATYTLPGLEFVGGVMGNDEERLDFRRDSRLFIITGMKNDIEEGKFYYLWDKGKLRLLAKRPIIKEEHSE